MLKVILLLSIITIGQPSPQPKPPSIITPNIAVVPFTGKTQKTGDPIKLVAPEFEMLQLDGSYTGKLTWDIQSPDGTAPPVKWFQTKPKSTIIGLRAGQTDVEQYDTPEAPAVALFPKKDGRAIVAAWGIGEDGSPKLLAKLIVDCLIGSKPPPDVLVTVPNLVGRSEANAPVLLRDVGLTLGTVTREVSQALEGSVIRQSPNAGEKVSKTTLISIVVSLGQPTPSLITTPNLVGMQQSVATSTLSSLGLTTGAVTSEPSTLPIGTVIRQSPIAGFQVSPTTAVALFVSAGNPPPIPIAEGFRVLILEEVGKRGSLPVSQLTALMSTRVSEYLNARCAKSETNTPDWHKWDISFGDTEIAKMPVRWQKAFAEAKKASEGKLPWLIVSNGVQGESIPLPLTEDELLTVLKKYGDK